MDTVWRSTDQKVRGSSPPERASVLSHPSCSTILGNLADASVVCHPEIGETASDPLTVPTPCLCQLIPSLGLESGARRRSVLPMGAVSSTVFIGDRWHRSRVLDPPRSRWTEQSPSGRYLYLGSSPGHRQIAHHHRSVGVAAVFLVVIPTQPVEIGRRITDTCPSEEVWLFRPGWLLPTP